VPTWGKILKELQTELKKKKKPPFDFVRRKYLRALQKQKETPFYMPLTGLRQKTSLQLCSI